MTPDAERAAWTDLIESAGWPLLKELVEKQHGAAAVMAHIKAQMQKTEPERALDAQQVIVPQIIAAADAAMNVIAMAEERLKNLTTATAAKPEVKFASWKRI